VYSNECKKGCCYSLYFSARLNISGEENHLTAWLKAKKNSGV
jgi:hypothetical protein